MGKAGTAKAEKRFDRTGFVVLCLIYLALAFLWDTVWIYPPKPDRAAVFAYAKPSSVDDLEHLPTPMRV